MSSSLADELLADVAGEESNTKDGEQQQDIFVWNNDKSRQAGHDVSVLPDTSMQYVGESNAHGAVERSNELESVLSDEKGPNESKGMSARSFSKLYENHALSELLKVRLMRSPQSIQQRMNQAPNNIMGALEDSEEYLLLVRANNMAVEIDHEMLALHKVCALTLKSVHP